MAHYLFNFSTGGRREATARLRARTWAVEDDERHRDALAPGDLALIYVAGSDAGFIGRAALATAVHEWSPSEAQARPDDSRSGVVLRDVEQWGRVVPMAIVAGRVDPTASNPLVQANAETGFGTRIVRITAEEYRDAVSAGREYQAL